MPPRRGSRWRGRARSISMSSESRSARSRPATNFATALRGLDHMQQANHDPQAAYWTAASTNDLVPEVPAEVLCGPQVNASSAEQNREFGFDPREREHAGGVRPGSNSTNRSTSLSAPGRPLQYSTRTGKARRMWLRLQSAANAARSAKSSSCTWISPHHAATALRGTRFTICSASSIIIRGTPTACSGCRLCCNRTAPNCPEAQSDCLCFAIVDIILIRSTPRDSTPRPPSVTSLRRSITRAARVWGTEQ